MMVEVADGTENGELNHRIELPELLSSDASIMYMNTVDGSNLESFEEGMVINPVVFSQERPQLSPAGLKDREGRHAYCR